MAYTKQTWENGNPATPVSASRMTHIENGIDAAHDTADAVAELTSTGRLSEDQLNDDYAVMGPVPSGGDDTAAFLAAMLEAQSTSGILRLHPGTYNLTNLATAQSFQQPLIYGAGVDRTTLNFTAGGVGIRYKGGSAGFSGGGIQDLTMTGAGATALEIQGACSVRVSRVRFHTLACGVLFHNATSGEFSEQNVMIACSFEASCTLWAEYRVTSGNDSFHGSGFEDCMFNAGASTSAKIKIGAGVLLYNAPFDGWIWAAGNMSIVDLSTATKAIYTYGNLRIEAGSGSTTTYWSTASTLSWSHAGQVTVFGETFRFNHVRPVRAGGSCGASSEHSHSPSAAPGCHRMGSGYRRDVNLRA